MNRLESELRIYAKSVGVDIEPEYRFHPTRRWRFDFAFPSRMIAVEYEGMTRQGGRHQRFSGFVADTEKYNEAALLGWKVIRVTAKTQGKMWEWLDRAFEVKQ